jgi:hypothetical protein
VLNAGTGQTLSVTVHAGRRDELHDRDGDRRDHGDEGDAGDHLGDPADLVYGAA